MSRPVIGWREVVRLPEWGIKAVEAKIDTGARTSAIHVGEVHRLPRGRVRFDVVLSRKDPVWTVPVETDVVRVTRVRSSTGHAQERVVVATDMRVGHVTRRIELTLVCRRHMLCRMLLGRTALEGFLIDVGIKHQLGKPPKPKRKKTS